MKIALFSWESLHSIAVGGIAAHVTELAAGLERRGHEVHVFVRMGRGQRPYDRIHGVHYHRCPVQGHHDFITEMNNMCNSFIWKLGEIESAEGPFNIVHGHDWLCAKAVVQAKNDRNRKAVFTMHSTEFGRCGNTHGGHHSARVRTVEAEGIFCADRVIAVSGVLGDEVKGLYEVPEWKLRTIRNGVHCKNFDVATDPGVVKRRYGVAPLDPTILFVGRLEVQKGPDLLMEAIPQVLRTRGDAKFIFVGEGSMRGQLERRCRELGIGHAVRLVGPMSGVSLAQVYRSCDAVCVPSRNEPFGIVLLEAWASKKPVIATENGGPREMVKPGVNGFLTTAAPDSIAWGIRQIFDDFDRAREMGATGRVMTEEGYSWDTIAAATEGVYRELLSPLKPMRAVRRIEKQVEETVAAVGSIITRETELEDTIAADAGESLF